PIAAFVSDTVVHDLERVQVTEEHRGHVIRPGRTGQRDGKPIHEQQPVRQPGERVVQAQLDELAFSSFPFGDISSVRDDSPYGRVLEAVRVDRLEPAPDPALVAYTQLRWRLRHVR